MSSTERPPYLGEEYKVRIQPTSGEDLATGRRVPATDVLIEFCGQHFGTRHNFALADTPANRNAELEAFKRRRLREVGN